jgi:hypothetical protein
MIVAKPVIQDQFWILRQDDQKIGNITATSDGFDVKINDRVTRFQTISMIAQRGIEFETVAHRPPPLKTNTVHGFPAQGRVFNPTWDVKHGLPLYTKTKKSKSWFCGGWYRIKQGRQWEVTESPKLIAVQRYPYQGPFYTKDQAQQPIPVQLP